MASARLKFPGASGQLLAARLDRPEGAAPAAYAIFAHCFTCSKDLKAAVHISRALNEAGIAVLRFDFTGLGESQGDFADTNFSSNVEDLVAAADFLARQHEAPRILVGHSLGGAAVLQAALRIPSAVAVATIGAPFSPDHVRHLFASSEAEIEGSGEAVVVLAGRSFRIRKQFLDDLQRHAAEEAVRHLGRALLIFHAPQDDLVGIENAAALYRAARHPKSFVSLDTADHLLTDERDSRYVGTVLAAWARRYVEAASPAPAPLSPPNDGIVVRTGRARFRTDVAARAHRMVADEPRALGGTDRGPTPYEYLAAALGACTTITLRMYADRKEMALDEVVVRVRHGRGAGGGKGDLLHREIELVGDLSEQERARLLEIADRCPVHRTLEAGVEITTSVAGLDPAEDAAATLVPG